MDFSARMRPLSLFAVPAIQWLCRLGYSFVPNSAVLLVEAHPYAPPSLHRPYREGHCFRAMDRRWIGKKTTPLLRDPDHASDGGWPGWNWTWRLQERFYFMISSLPQSPPAVLELLMVADASIKWNPGPLWLGRGLLFNFVGRVQLSDNAESYYGNLYGSRLL